MAGIQPNVQFGAIYVVSKRISDDYRHSFGHVWDGHLPVTEWFTMMAPFVQPAGAAIDLFAPVLPVSGPFQHGDNEGNTLSDGRTMIITDDDDLIAFHDFRDNNWIRMSYGVLFNNTTRIWQRVYEAFLAEKEAEEEDAGITPGDIQNGSRIHYIG